ncbi:MAG TPA: UvrD-helicase domain-containing protein [Longimicrobiales bacterium]|nr:UvrD-helicase domain-containing protein [Longimicrobiales bacterium]
MSDARGGASYLRGLNPEQQRAVLHTEGPLLVLAGAGSGKTKTLVHRMAHLIRGKKVDPARIVVVTFTNKAAEEMRERARAYGGDEVRRVTISTFHALGVRILREHAQRMGLPRRFAIYSTPDQLSALKTACGEIHVGDQPFDLKRVMRQISDWKGRRMEPAQAKREVAAQEASGTRADDYAVLAADAYARYEEVLRASGAVDFDDLLLLPVKLLEEHEEARRDLWRRWHYFMIDEYQDTSPVQLAMARLLAGQRRNLCVVGDDDQSIYAFRGADVANILGFEEHFPGAAVVTLEQNYRSTRRILGAANAIIAGNPHRHPKRLRTDNGVGAPLDYYEHADERLEAETVAKEIALRRFRGKRAWEDFAILYRTNTQSRPLEEALREKGIPYRVVGGTAFFDRKEVADGVAYLRAVANPGDEIALRRIINYPTRGIGRTTVLKVAEVARERRCSFLKALSTVTPDDVGAAQHASIRAFMGRLASARVGLERAESAAARPSDPTGLPPLARWALELFEELRLFDAVRDDHHRNPRVAEMRVDNLRDLGGTIARYERRRWTEAPDGERFALQPDGEAGDEPWAPPTLEDALARLALAELEEEEDERDDEGSGVTLMTLHSAKGLEFPEVFLVGLEEGILPHARSLEEEGAGADSLAEERRLLYVGITRAKDQLTLSCCTSRSRWGEAVPVLPSRYLEEIPAELLNVKTAGAELTEEESHELRSTFFDKIRGMLEEPG